MKKLIPKFIFQIYHYSLASIGAVIYGFPSKKMIVVGVTGTNGKSTVVHLITEILEFTPQLRGKVASLSSIRFKVGDKEEKNMLKMTMPGRLKLQKFLRRAVNAGCKYMVLEVTSEGIKQFRHKFIDFDGAVFTNLTKEHIEAHKGFENYKKAKGKLFEALENSPKKDKFAVLNSDDENSVYFDKLFSGKKYFYGINLPVGEAENQKTEITPDKIGLKPDNLLGEFNLYNALAAYCAGIALGIEKNKVLETLKIAKGIPGRLELVINEPFKVFVDYAHTPDGLENIYKTLGRNLICVLGSTGGGRDKWKRPEMGKIAANYCKNIILTNEDPYDENPLFIIEDIEKGFSQISAKDGFASGGQFSISKILDRREAINKALFLAQKDDTVIITGKGCEPWMCVEDGKKISWDDREIVREEYRKLMTQN